MTHWEMLAGLPHQAAQPEAVRTAPDRPDERIQPAREPADDQVLSPGDVAPSCGGGDRPPNRAANDATLLDDLDQPRSVAGQIPRRRRQHLNDHRVVEAEPGFVSV